MGRGSWNRGAGALLLGLVLLCGCAAPGKGAKPDQPEPPFSVHLPVMETTDMDVRSQPPVVQPELALPPPHPSDSGVEEGKARSLNLLEIRHDGGKGSGPPANVPTEPEQKP